MKTGDRMIRISTAATVVGIGAVAGIISYRHVLDVATGHGETGATARMLPFTVDGLLFTASLVLLDSARRGQRAPLLAKTALGLGIGATVAANVLHGIAHGPIGAVISAWPAVTLVVVVELLMGLIRRGRTSTETAGIQAVAPLADPATITLDAPPFAPLVDATPVEAFPQTTGGDSSDPLAETPAHLAAWLANEGQDDEGQDNDAGDEDEDWGTVPDPDPALPKAREHFAALLSMGAVPSIRAIKRELRVGWDRATRIHAALGESN